eukprot:4109120-Pyramimonas_sp.AAC.1
MRTPPPKPSLGCDTGRRTPFPQSALPSPTCSACCDSPSLAVGAFELVPKEGGRGTGDEDQEDEKQ